MDFKSELEEFRKRFKKNREKQAETFDKEDDDYDDEEFEAGSGLTWADDIEVPQPGGMQGLNPEEFAEDVEIPEIMTDNDARFSGDKDADNNAFVEYMMNDPVFQQVGPEMEAILDEIIAQASDPENPMTQEEAARVFLEMMEERFGSQFR